MSLRNKTLHAARVIIPGKSSGQGFSLSGGPLALQRGVFRGVGGIATALLGALETLLALMRRLGGLGPVFGHSGPHPS